MAKNMLIGYPRFSISVPILLRFSILLDIGSNSVSVLKKSSKTAGSSVSVRTDPALLCIIQYPLPILGPVSIAQYGSSITLPNLGPVSTA